MTRSQDAADEVAALLQRWGHVAVSDGMHGMVVMRFAGGHETTMRVEAVTTATPEHARPFEDGALMVVADRIPERVRRIYNDEGVSWWDRRGHLRVTSGPVFVDADVPAEPRPRSYAGTNPLAGTVVAGVSITALSAFPNPIPGVRELARQLDASPGGVSLAAKRLIDAGLLTVDRVAAQPGLFRAVSDQWRPDWNTIEGTPTPADGLVAVGSLAAAELGAPLAVTRDAPIELLAADRAAYRRAIRSSAVHGPARIALAPTPAACDAHGPEATVTGHRCASPVVVAALLATDPGRGAEIIEDWEMVDRAW